MNVNIEQDAADLRKAMKGMGTDEDAIIKIVANRTNAQRQKIKESYNKQFNRDIIKDLKSELRGKLEDVVIGLFQTQVEYDCDQLKKAMKGSGTDESTLIEIIATRPNWYILGYFISCIIEVVAITIQYGHASDKIDGVGVAKNIERFDEFDNF